MCFGSAKLQDAELAEKARLNEESGYGYGHGFLASGQGYSNGVDLNQIKIT